jgi:hypothetical protein
MLQLRRAVKIDPRNQDFFRVVIEERRRLSSLADFSEVEKERLDKALKVLANAASYGIYAEMIRQVSYHMVYVRCHGIDAKSFTCRVAHPDVPGEYCFPPLASLFWPLHWSRPREALSALHRREPGSIRSNWALIFLRRFRRVLKPRTQLVPA